MNRWCTIERKLETESGCNVYSYYVTFSNRKFKDSFIIKRDKTTGIAFNYHGVLKFMNYADFQKLDKPNDLVFKLLNGDLIVYDATNHMHPREPNPNGITEFMTFSIEKL